MENMANRIKAEEIALLSAAEKYNGEAEPAATSCSSQVKYT